MKVYVGTKKVEDRYRYGVTVYSDKGTVLHSAIKTDEVHPNKFHNTLLAIQWAIVKLKAMAQNKTISDTEPVIFVVSSKTVYGWFEKGVSPSPYLLLFSDIMLDMSFMVNPLEILYIQTGEKKVLYRSSQEEKKTRLVDLI